MKTPLLLLLALGLVGCTKDEKPAPSAPPPAASSASAAAVNAAKVTDLGPGKQRIDGQNFTLDVAAAACKANAECALTIKLVAAAEYHVNKEYPYKFTASAAPGVTYLGKKDAAVFTKETGDFVEEGEKTGTMTVRFKPSAAGDAKIAGTYKMSVCSANQCQIEVQPVALNVKVD